MHSDVPREHFEESAYLAAQNHVDAECSRYSDWVSPINLVFSMAVRKSIPIHDTIRLALV